MKKPFPSRLLVWASNRSLRILVQVIFYHSNDSTKGIQYRKKKSILKMPHVPRESECLPIYHPNNHSLGQPRACVFSHSLDR